MDTTLDLDCIINILKFLPFKQRVSSSIVCKSWYDINPYIFDTITVNIYLYFTNEYYKKWVDKIKPKSYTLKACGDIFLLTSFLDKFTNSHKVLKMYINSGNIHSILSTIYKCKNLSELKVYNGCLYHNSLNVSRFLNLRTLDLNSVNLKCLSNDVCDIPLKYLNLTFNNLTTLPDNFANLKNTLISLHIGKNLFSTIPETVYELENLQTLNFCHNDIAVIHNDISKLKKLKRIVFRGNCLTTIPSTICEMSDLVHFDFGCNSIEKIPRKIDKLINLNYFDIEYNDLRVIPESFYKLVNLTTLHLTSNYVTNISDKIGNLCNLKTLYFNDNRLNYIPHSINNLVKLQYLQLCDNKIQHIYIPKLVNLTFLDIHNNFLEIVPDIQDFTKLQYLILYNNLFSAIDASLFKNLNMLKQLVINVNTHIDFFNNKIQLIKL